MGWRDEYAKNMGDFLRHGNPFRQMCGGELISDPVHGLQGLLEPEGMGLVPLPHVCASSPHLGFPLELFLYDLVAVFDSQGSERVSLDKKASPIRGPVLAQGLSKPLV